MSQKYNITYLPYNKKTHSLLLKRYYLDFFKFDGYDWTTSEKYIEELISIIHLKLESNNHIITIVKYNNTEIGLFYIQLPDKKDFNAVLNFLYFIPEFRKKGFGQQVFKYIKKMLTSKNIYNMILMVTKNNEIAVNFYKKLGFKICRYQMHKNLK